MQDFPNRLFIRPYLSGCILAIVHQQYLSLYIRRVLI